MATLGTTRLLKIVAGPALLFGWSSSALAFVIAPFSAATTLSRGAALAAFIGVPDALAAYWLFRVLRLHRAASDARRGAAAFAFTAPIVLGVGYVLGELVGAWAEVFLGGTFILPAIAVFISALMATIPGLVLSWALHPSGGVAPLNKGPR